MPDNRLIPADEFCIHHNIEISFIHSLQEYSLVQITTLENRRFIDENDLEELEKMRRLHYELGINFEGLDAIRNLLGQVQQMQKEITGLKNRLRLYETNE